MGPKMTEYRSTFFVALGGNLGNQTDTPLQTLQASVAEFRADDLEITRISRFFKTPCFPAGAGPDYVNAAVALRTALSAQDVLSRLHAIETRFQRRRDQRWGMRTLDLDLIAAGQVILPDEAGYAHWRDLPLEQQSVQAPQQLILPHPRLQDRSFVLVPLADIAPHWRHPVLGLSVLELLALRPQAERDEVQPL